MTLRLHFEAIEMTQPGDTNRWYRHGKRRAYLEFRIPVWLARLLRKGGVAA